MSDDVQLPDWLRIARECVGADDWVEIVTAAVIEAKMPGAAGQKARDFVASIVLPPEKDRSNPTGNTVREVRIVLAPKPDGAVEP